MLNTKGLEKSLCDFTGTNFPSCVNPNITGSLNISYKAKHQKSLQVALPSLLKPSQCLNRYCAGLNFRCLTLESDYERKNVCHGTQTLLCEVPSGQAPCGSAVLAAWARCPCHMSPLPPYPPFPISPLAALSHVALSPHMALPPPL